MTCRAATETPPLPPAAWPRAFTDRLRSSAALVMVMVLGLWSAPASAQTALEATPPTQVARVISASGIWDTGGGFRFDLGKKKLLKTRQSVSGIACNLDAHQQRVCLVVFDEGIEARYAVVGKGMLRTNPEPISLREGNGAEAGESKGELDAEGAATDGRYFYVTGSHSAKRNDCSSNPASRHVIRFRVDPATGRALRSPSGALADLADTGRLWDVMQLQPALQAHVGEQQCLGSELPPKAKNAGRSLQGRQGVNIEGLAIRDGRLYFGFRGPALNGVAYAMAVDADALFSSGDVKAELTQLALGPNRGIRDMVAVSDGLLLLAGPDDSPANRGVSWTVSWWDGKTASGGPAVIEPKLLATLDLGAVRLRACDAELKPEAITVLAETTQAYDLLVLSDGLCDGGPMRFTVPR